MKPEPPRPEPQQSAEEWNPLCASTWRRIIEQNPGKAVERALALARRCDEAEEERANAVITRDQWSKEVDALTEQLAAERAKVSTLPSLVASLNELQAEVIQTKAQLGAAQAEAGRLREALEEIANKCSHFLGCPVGPSTIAEIARTALAKEGGE